MEFVPRKTGSKQKRMRDAKEEKQKRLRIPQAPQGNYGAGGALGQGTGGTLLTQFLLKEKGALRPRSKEMDPREAILRHAEAAAADPKFVETAYLETQVGAAGATPAAAAGGRELNLSRCSRFDDCCRGACEANNQGSLTSPPNTQFLPRSLCSPPASSRRRRMTTRRTRRSLGSRGARRPRVVEGPGSVSCWWCRALITGSREQRGGCCGANYLPPVFWLAGWLWLFSLLCWVP